MGTYSQIVALYLQALHESDFTTILSLFAKDATVHSPFLGKMKPETFFKKVLDSSAKSDIKVYDILESVKGERRAAGYFHYRWTLRDGTKADFDCADVFEFDGAGKIASLIILYDTYPIRERVGDKVSY
jgi:hypothetical protein